MCEHASTEAFFFPARTSGNFKHCGHLQIPPGHVPVSIKASASTELDDIVDQLSRFVFHEAVV
jgi:hypothetical protein